MYSGYKSNEGVENIEINPLDSPPNSRALYAHVHVHPHLNPAEFASFLSFFNPRALTPPTANTIDTLVYLKLMES